MKLTSPAFFHGAIMPMAYTCDGTDVNPPLKIENVPPGTQSLALIVDDPDAEGSPWVHWLLWNINPNVILIDEQSTPGGAVSGITSFGHPGYGGPCPPNGEHHYHFKIYALDIMLDLPHTADKKGLEDAMAGHIIGAAELVGIYQSKE